MTDTPTTGSTDPAQYSPDQLASKGRAGDAPRADVNLDLVLDIPVDISLRVGSTEISIRDLVSLVEGSVIALDQDAGAPILTWLSLTSTKPTAPFPLKALQIS
jgi:flagellar motor switch protein FliN/FliY